MALYLGIDCGTQGTKALVLDAASGQVLGAGGLFKGRQPVGGVLFAVAVRAADQPVDGATG